MLSSFTGFIIRELMDFVWYVEGRTALIFANPDVNAAA